ncbi:MAG TPA: DUF502 domain-containing protein [Desulfuromonadales bacterium]|nr:DUF502 domain-containing protein [Desulfuromonadales bacterium]
MTRWSAFGRLFRYRLKNYFLTGLLVVVPLGLTYLVVRWIVTAMDRMLGNLLPAAWHPDQLFGMPLPGLGLIATLLLILIIGLLTANIFGRKLVHFYERMVNKIPLVKGIYGLFKQVADTMLSRERSAFRKVVLIEYPRRGIWSVAFVTGVSAGEVQEITDQRLVNLFVPTTPNPTSGFYLLVPEKDLILLSMTVEEAFKLIISGGMVTPPDRRRVRKTGQLEVDTTAE